MNHFKKGVFHSLNDSCGGMSKKSDSSQTTETERERGRQRQRENKEGRLEGGRRYFTEIHWQIVSLTYWKEEIDSRLQDEEKQGSSRSGGTGGHRAISPECCHHMSHLPWFSILTSMSLGLRSLAHTCSVLNDFGRWWDGGAERFPSDECQ